MPYHDLRRITRRHSPEGQASSFQPGSPRLLEAPNLPCGLGNRDSIALRDEVERLQPATNREIGYIILIGHIGEALYASELLLALLTVGFFLEIRNTTSCGPRFQAGETG